ncbi:MAG: efflux RND transporter periplasmic adaptor subunit, partial [Acidobacteriota bacterium]
RLEKMTLAAPFSGVVGLRGVSEGSVVTSQTPIVTLQKLDPIKLDFAIPERYAGFARPGTRVEFEVAGSAETFVGDIYAVEPAVEAATRSVRVRARAANPEGRLLPGAFAEVQWTLAERPSALLVPSIAVLSDLDASSVLLAVEGVVERRRVELGRRTDDFVEVTSGLERGDAVILTGLQQLRPGDPVTLVESGERS